MTYQIIIVSAPILLSEPFCPRKALSAEVHEREPFQPLSRVRGSCHGRAPASGLGRVDAAVVDRARAPTITPLRPGVHGESSPASDPTHAEAITGLNWRRPSGAALQVGASQGANRWRLSVLMIAATYACLRGWRPKRCLRSCSSSSQPRVALGPSRPSIPTTNPAGVEARQVAHQLGLLDRHGARA